MLLVNDKWMHKTSPVFQNAVSLFIRLGFAHKKTATPDSKPPPSLHPSWNNLPPPPSLTEPHTPLTLETGGSDSEGGQRSPSPGVPHPLFANHTNIKLFCVLGHARNQVLYVSDSTVAMVTATAAPSSGVFQKRIAFLFDATLTAFLMMGNLSPVSP